MNELPAYLDYTRRLEDWFWRYGSRRKDPYALPPGKWLLDVAHSRQRIRRGEEALRRPRPAMAIWGPSQTGKSTIVSAYVDAGAHFSGDPENDGDGSGLHWPDGKRFFFMAPRQADPQSPPAHLTRMVLNPFNKGMDGSACLTRFVPGALDERPGHYHVRDPRHPVELHLVQLDDLWHALARGYSTECLGSNDRKPRAWDLERIQRATDELLKNADRHLGTPDKKAFDELLRLSEVLDDLAASDEPVFTELSTDRDAWQAYLRSLFEQPALLASRDLVRRLAEKVLWNDAPAITRWFRSFAEYYDERLGPGGEWSDRPLRCSLEAAALFLNMGASDIAYGKPVSNPEAPEYIIQDLIGRLAYRIDDDAVLIGCESDLPHRVGSTPEEFCLLQGLVWELVVPINMDHLQDRPFSEDADRPNALKKFLESADILDFPGVGNETKSLENRIIIDEKRIAELKRRVESGDASEEDKTRVKKCFTPLLFFREILKRGKTASIVATYGKRLNMDAFSVFQSVSHYACPNADQIINGVNAWWRHLAPGYLQNPQGESPFPLNLVITWWANKLNFAKNPNDSNIYGVIDQIVKNLGIVRDPQVASTFAIHDHNSPDRARARIEVDFSPGSTRHKNLVAESLFQDQFQKEISRESFDAMLTDKLTGGAEFFFDAAREQIRSLTERDDNRLKRIARQIESAFQNLHGALSWPELAPEREVRDTRRERLEAFLAAARKVIEGLDEKEMKRLNRFLRELFNVRATDLPRLTQDQKRAVTAQLIERQFDTWAAEQADRLENGSSLAECRDMLFDQGSALRDFLRAVVESIRPDCEEIAGWLRKRLQYDTAGTSPAQLQRLLAVRMGTALTYGEEGPLSEMPDSGSEIPAHRYFLEPLIGPGGHVERLAMRGVKRRERPEQDGDPEIRKLLDEYHELRGAPAEESVTQ